MAFPQFTESFGSDDVLDNYANWTSLSDVASSPFVLSGECQPEGDATAEKFKTHTSIYSATACDTITQCGKFKIQITGTDGSSVGVILRQANSDGSGACYHLLLQATGTAGTFDIKVDRLTGLTFGETIVNDANGVSALSDGDWVGFAVSGTGNATEFYFWDFGASDPGDYSAWGAATNTYTDDPSTAVDTGAYVGVRFYVGNTTTEPHQAMSSWAAGDTAAAPGGVSAVPLLMHQAMLRR